MKCDGDDTPGIKYTVAHRVTVQRGEQDGGDDGSGLQKGDQLNNALTT